MKKVNNKVMHYFYDFCLRKLVLSNRYPIKLQNGYYSMYPYSNTLLLGEDEIASMGLPDITEDSKPLTVKLICVNL